jgi:hypothetical protein
VIEWLNVYDLGHVPHLSAPWNSPKHANIGPIDGSGRYSKYWLRIEERWNGHVRRTPVGMRADQASHRWAWNGRTANGFKLEPRHD